MSTQQEEATAVSWEWVFILLFFGVLAILFTIYTANVTVSQVKEDSADMFAENKAEYQRKFRIAEAERKADRELKTTLLSKELDLPINEIVYSEDTVYGEVFFTPDGIYKAEFNFQDDKKELTAIQKVNIKEPQ